MSREERIKFIIESNPSLFGLHVVDYKNGNLIMSDPSESALKKAEKDYEHFQESQEAIYKREEISQGDWVEQEDGTLSRVTVSSWSDTVQVGGNYGGSFHVNSNGFCSYSGGCGDSIKREELFDTGDYKEGLCWIFSERYVGAHRGVNNILRFKLWKQIKK
jgi:hypothetical protein